MTSQNRRASEDGMQGQIVELAPSLHRLGGSAIVNSYLVADSTGVTIIDAGLPGY